MRRTMSKEFIESISRELEDQIALLAELARFKSQLSDDDSRKKFDDLLRQAAKKSYNTGKQILENAA